MDMINGTLGAWLRSLTAQPDDWGVTQRLAVIAFILLMAWLADLFCRRVVVRAIRKLTAKTQVTWDDYLFNDKVLGDACHLVPPVVLSVLLPFALPAEPVLLDFLLRLCTVYITVVTVRLVCSFLTSLYTITNEHEQLRKRSMKGFYQMLKLVVVCIGVIVIVSTFIDKNPMDILMGLGASAAILTLVFKDTIMGLVAGVQLTANDMLRPGDWITMPKYGADGEVLEVTLTTVKVQNWDKTISTIPPYALVNDSFQNWRGMWESGGRRVKRSLNIDMHTVRFCTEEEMAAYLREEWMQGFERTGDKEVNLYVFRHYVDYYLHHHPKVHQRLTMMVRQLQPTADGLPIELYFFSDGIAWIPYERLQAEVFEHLLAVLPAFGLKVFQRPTGLDLQGLKG